MNLTANPWTINLTFLEKRKTSTKGKEAVAFFTGIMNVFSCVGVIICEAGTAVLSCSWRLQFWLLQIGIKGIAASWRGSVDQVEHCQ